jgi:ankyrin repeat protein
MTTFLLPPCSNEAPTEHRFLPTTIIYRRQIEDEEFHEAVCNKFGVFSYHVLRVAFSPTSFLHEGGSGIGCNAFHDLCCFQPRTIPQQLGTIMGPQIPDCVFNNFMRLDGVKNLLTETDNADAATPLHLACEVGSVHTVRKLLTLKPELALQMALEKDGRGRTPLDVVWLRHNGDYEMYECTQTRDLAEPIQLQGYPLWWIMDMIEDVDHFESEEFVGSAHENNDVKNTWGKTLEIIAALVGDTDCKMTDGSGLIRALAACRDGIPNVVLWFAHKLYPEQVSKRDERGNYPLHHVLSPSKHVRYGLSAAPDDISELRADFQDDDDSYDYVGTRLEQIIEEAEDSPARMLLSYDTDQIHARNNDGRLPFHLACESGASWQESVQPLLSRVPNMVNEVDPVTKLFPFMLAAVNLDDKDSSVDVVYELLTRNPSHLLGGIPTTAATVQSSSSRKRKRSDMRVVS